MYRHRWPARRFVAVLAALSASFPALCRAQADMSDFNPDAELRRLAEMPPGFARVQRYYYLGDLTSNSGRTDVAREAYRQAFITFQELSGNHRTLALAYAAQAALGLAGLTHLEFRDAPLRWETYSADSARRWALLTNTRDEYNRVATLGYARATFEALYLRAQVLEEWDTGRLDTLAEREPGVPPLVTCIRHLSTAIQLSDEAGREYRRILTLADSLGLTGGTGDENVSEWTGAARERQEELRSARQTLFAREEALQALYAERQSAQWMERALPLLWERAAELTQRDAGVADPFFDYYIQTKLVNNAFRPFMFGPDGFYTSHANALDIVRSVRSEGWINERLKWQRQQEWLDSDISRRLAREGIAQLRRVPASLDTMVTRLAAAADSLPAEVQVTLSRLPPMPKPEMPEIPDFSGMDPRMLGEQDSAKIDEYYRYQERMSAISKEIETYRAMVRAFGERMDRLGSRGVPPELESYNRWRQGLETVNVLLLDTLGTWVIDQANRALEHSRSAAVWLPPGPQSVAAQQAISDYAGAAAGDFRTIAQEYRDEASRYRMLANRLHRRPPAFEMIAQAEALEGFAARLEGVANQLSPVVTGS